MICVISCLADRPPKGLPSAPRRAPSAGRRELPRSSDRRRFRWWSRNADAGPPETASTAFPAPHARSSRPPGIGEASHPSSICRPFSPPHGSWIRRRGKGPCRRRSTAMYHRAREATLMETFGSPVFARAGCAIENCAPTVKRRRCAAPAGRQRGIARGRRPVNRLRCIKLEHRAALSPRRANDAHSATRDQTPVLANVLAILMVVIGAVALMRLAVAQYPNVVPPTISVTTRYPGASARAVVDTVALPIEQQVNGVDGMIYMQSWSAADGSYTLIVTFKIGMDINFAQVLVQNRVSSALAQLPQAVQAQGVTVQQKSTAILQFVTLISPDERYDSLFLANYATISLQPELARLPGVGQVNIFGAGQYSMRVWLDPNKLYARSLTTEDVVNALKGQNQQ